MGEVVRADASAHAGAYTDLRLTGVMRTPMRALAQLDLALVDTIVSDWAKNGDGGVDDSWRRLAQMCSAHGGASRPYQLYNQGNPDDLGVRGVCWISLGAFDRGDQMLLMQYADTLIGAEVEVVVRFGGGRYGQIYLLEGPTPLEEPVRKAQFYPTDK